MDGAVRPPPDGGGSIDAGDGGGPAVEVLPSCAAAGQRVMAARAIRQAPGEADTCDHGNVTLTDDLVAGLDRTTDETLELDGQLVSACVGIDFQRRLPLDAVRIRAAATADACGRPCDGALCEQGRAMEVFHAVEPGTWSHLGRYPLTEMLEEHEIALPAESESQLVLVCRGADGVGASDIVVDAIAAVCSAQTPFGEPVLVEELFAPEASNDDPSLTADMLELYFDTDRAGTSDIWRATRSSVDAPWGAPEPVAILNSRASEGTPELAPDGLTLWFASDRLTTGTMDVWVTQRASREEPWSTATLANGLGINSPSNERGAAPAADGHMLFFQSDREGSLGGWDLYLTERAAPTEPWEAAAHLVEISSTGKDISPFPTQDALLIYFASDRSGVTNLYVAARRSVEEPFDAPSPVTTVNSDAIDEDAWVSPGGGVMYFASRRGGGLAQIYRADR